MDKEYVEHIHSGILLSHKKEENWVIHCNVDESRVCPTATKRLHLNSEQRCIKKIFHYKM